MLYTFWVLSKKFHSLKLITVPENFIGSEIFSKLWTQWRWYFYETVKCNWKIQILLFFLHTLHLYFLKLFLFGLISDELWSYGKNPYPYDFVMSHLLSFLFFVDDTLFFILVLILLVEIWLCMAQPQSCTCWAAILPFFPIYSSSRIFLHCLIYLPIIIFSPKPSLYSIASFI